MDEFYVKPQFEDYKNCSNGYRIYYKRYEDIQGKISDSGFEFQILEGYEDDSLTLVAWGRAYFDGIRHLYFTCDGDEVKEDSKGNYGYLYYPDLKFIQTLIEMEKEFCRYGDSSEKS